VLKFSTVEESNLNIESNCHQDSRAVTQLSRIYKGLELLFSFIIRINEQLSKTYTFHHASR
jgi:hypothetical protein